MDYVSIILVILGWIVVHFFSRNRDLKKEARSFALETVKHITLIEEKSIKYHLNNERDINEEHIIKLKLNDLDSRINVLKKSIKFKHDVSFFRSAITLNNFNSHQFTSQSYGSDIINDISFNAMILREALYKSSLK